MRAWIPLVVGLVMPACAGAGTDRRSVTQWPRSGSVPKTALAPVSVPGPRQLADRDPAYQRRLAAGKVRLELTSEGVGHAFPTGDLFRRLEVFVEAVGDDAARTFRATRYLTRHYRPAGAAGIPARAVLDDRLGVDGQPRREVELDLGTAAARWPLIWRVAYRRGEHPAGASEENAVVESEVVLATGELAPAPPTPPEVVR